MTYESDAAGVLEILAAEGDTLAVGEPIARIGDQAAPAAGEAAASPPSAAEASSETPVPAAGAQSAPSGEPAQPAVRVEPAGSAAATPLARRAAGAHGVALDALSGSGPRGRITKADVLAAAGATAQPPRVVAGNGGAPAAAPAIVSSSDAGQSPAPPAPPAEGARIEPMTRLQQVVARRMVEAKAVPEFQVQAEVAMDQAIALRAQLKQAAGDGRAPSFNDLIVKAAALALREHPRANASFREEGFELHERINVGVAVAADDALVVPTLFDADRKSLGEISRETRRLAERVRSGEITPPELSGGTFTVSNLGMFGMTAIVPVINPPQAGILGVGAMRPVLARDAEGEIVDRQLLTLTLTCDHRILYGADAARFLSDIARLLESPLGIAL
jgi:pyruvate dehydrogenase E2 component (dihydrolipoamide acetyltransferase)